MEQEKTPRKLSSARKQANHAHTTLIFSELILVVSLLYNYELTDYSMESKLMVEIDGIHQHFS